MLRQHPVCLTHIAKKFSRFHQRHYLYEVKLGKNRDAMRKFTQRKTPSH